jgi:hypothetical protein
MNNSLLAVALIFLPKEVLAEMRALSAQTKVPIRELILTWWKSQMGDN